MLIDKHLSEYSVTQVFCVWVEASPGVTWAALRDMDLMRISRLVNALMWLRALPIQLAGLVRRSEQPPAMKTAKLDDIVGPGSPFVSLGEEPGVEMLAGSIGKFWQPAIEWKHVEAGDFAAFDEPAFGKLAIDFRVWPYGNSGSLLTYEARTYVPDRESLRKFRRYWFIISRFSAYMMKRALACTKADAERRQAAPGRA
jgi:hypothetical protein